MLKLHDFCNRADGIVFCNMGISLVPHIDDFVMGAAQRLGQRVASEAAAASSGVKPDIGGDEGGRRSEEHTSEPSHSCAPRMPSSAGTKTQLRLRSHAIGR